VRDRPETRYVLTEDGVHIGYQVFGEGPVDLIYNDGWMSNVDAGWDIPLQADFWRALGRRARVIMFDRRGFGVSDRPTSPEEMALERGMDDMLAVMDAAGSERAIAFGFEAGAAVCLLAAASYPDRILGLLLQAPLVYYWKTPDFPWGSTEAFAKEWEERVRTFYGTEDFWRWNFEDMGYAATDEEVWMWAKWSRLCASPQAALAIEQVEQQVDVRALLPHIQVPTTVVLKAGDLSFDGIWGAAPWVAEQIPGARYEELPGSAHFSDASDTAFFDVLDRFISEISNEQAELDRVLATVLFTDIVDSTATAAVMGDTKWREVVADHDRLAQGVVGRFRGKFVRGTGDGMLATFDGPARAVRCAQAMIEAVKPLGIEVRAGAHTGEITYGGNDLAGIGVHVAARVAAMGSAGEVWTSSTVKDLTAGSGLTFEDAGEHELKGVPDSWRLYRVVTDGD